MNGGAIENLNYYEENWNMFTQGIAMKRRTLTDFRPIFQEIL